MRIILTACLILIIAGPNVLAGEAKRSAPRGTQMDYGPFLSYGLKTVASPNFKEWTNVSAKGICIKLGKSGDIAACFDTDLMRYTVGWTGGFLDLTKTNIGDLKGTEPATIKGAIQFSTKPDPGWSKDGSFTDPRPIGLGPLPKDWAHYKGLYLNGSRVVLSYSVGDNDVLESPGVITENGNTIFTRTIQLRKTFAPLSVLICDVAGAKTGSENTGTFASLEKDSITAAAIQNAPSGAKLQCIDNSRIVLQLPPLGAPCTFNILIWNGAKSELAAFQNISKKESTPQNLESLCKGGPANWAEEITTHGTLGTDKGAYVVDVLTLPDNNPWKAWMRPSGLDFLSDGRAVVSTLNGDVWIVSGIDSNLEKLTWKRFATGLYEPLGLKVVEDKIYVLGRDQITLLHDLNNDEEADFYENFNNDSLVSPIYHAFAFDLQTDSKGNFYYARGGNQVEHDLPDHSAMIKVCADGGKMEVIATGFRAPNGMGIGPNDEIVCGDNQGHWISSSKINLIKKGGFYGYMGDPRRTDPKHPGPKNASYDQPLVWIPYSWDNSSGGQVFVTTDKFGPLKGHMLHLSYGKCALFNVMTEESGGQMQGALVKFPLTFASGIMRARFSPKDGQLYTCGLKGWQTSGARDGTISRVRYTGKALEMPVDFHVVHDGVQITFNDALDDESAKDAQNYGVEAWNYTWTKEYNAPEIGNNAHHDQVACDSVKVSADHKSVTLHLPGLKPVAQMMIKMKIKSASGELINTTVANTIHHVP